MPCIQWQAVKTAKDERQSRAFFTFQNMATYATLVAPMLGHATGSAFEIIDKNFAVGLAIDVSKVEESQPSAGVHSWLTFFLPARWY